MKYKSIEITKEETKQIFIDYDRKYFSVTNDSNYRIIRNLYGDYFGLHFCIEYFFNEKEKKNIRFVFVNGQIIAVLYDLAENFSIFGEEF